MAGLFLDSFDAYATANLLQKWTTGNLATFISTITVTSGGRNATNALTIHVADGNAFCNIRKTLAPSGATAIMGFAVNVSALSGTSSANQLCQILDGSTAQFSVRVRGDGNIEVLRGSYAGTSLGVSSVIPLTTGLYYYVEIKAVLSTTVGTIDIQVNDTSVLSLTGLNNANAGTTTWTQFRLGADGSANNGIADWLFDDLYLCDGSGGVNDDFLGDGRVVNQVPSTGNGANTDWTPSTGSDHGALVDEIPPNTTDYNASSTPGDLDTYVYPALGVSGDVAMVQTCLFAVKSDAGGRTVAPVQRIGGTDFTGTAVSLGTDYAYLLQVYDVSPDTSTAWTTTEIDATETGIALVS